MAELFSVQMPDGTTITRKLPDGATDAQVRAAFRSAMKKYGFNVDQADVQWRNKSNEDQWRQQLGDQGEISEPEFSIGGALENTLGDILGGVLSERQAARIADKAFNFVNDWTPVGNVTGMEDGATMARNALTRGDLGTAALGAGVFAMSAIPGVPRQARVAGENALMALLRDESGAIRAYHVSPHDFDKFSMDHLGTGEGAQQYGRGLYFAERGDGPTAKHYKKMFGPKSKTYEVEIDADHADILDYDAPAWRQPEPVQRLMREVGMYQDAPELPISQTANGKFSLKNVWGEHAGSFKTRAAAEAKRQQMLDGMGAGTGNLLYTRLGGNPYYPHLDDGSATKRLMAEGIKGGKWRNASNEPNYVVFDDGLVNIQNKY